MLMNVTQQAVPLACHDRCETFPTFEGEHPLADVFATFGAMPGIEEVSGIVLDAATNAQFRRNNTLGFSGAVSAQRGGRQESPR